MASNKRTNTSFFGLLLILVGAFLFVYNMDIISFDIENIWPAIPSVLAIAIWFNFFKSPEDYEQIMSATVLTVYSAMFWTTFTFEYYYMSEIWPFFILGPALGYWLMEFSPYKKKDYKIQASIISVIGLIFLFDSFDLVYGEAYLGLVLIALGGLLLLRKSN
jgi:membrane-bound ClpP family serine protease